jgi:hypothetical protein
VSSEGTRCAISASTRNVNFHETRRIAEADALFVIENSMFMNSIKNIERKTNYSMRKLPKLKRV